METVCGLLVPPSLQVKLPVNPDAVSVEVPLQLSNTLTEGIELSLGFTVMLIALDVAGLPVAQIALDVITQVITFPFAKPFVE
jgi:hypothetical protein